LEEATDGRTLAFLAAALERRIVDDHRKLLRSKLTEIQGALSQVDHILTADEAHCVVDRLAVTIEAVHLGIADLMSDLDRPAEGRRLPR
jgi:hypothetical protein